MILIDFLIFYLTSWFEQNKEKLKWSTPVERACYAFGIASMLFLFAIDICVQNTLHMGGLSMPFYLLVIIGLGMIMLYNYIYVQKDRISILRSTDFLFAKKLNDQKRVVITFIIFFILVLSPFISMLIFVHPQKKL